MTRKADSGANQVSTRAAPLRNLRSQIDKLDLQIVDLLNKRAGLAAEIGRVKNDQGTEVFTPLGRGGAQERHPGEQRPLDEGPSGPSSAN